MAEIEIVEEHEANASAADPLWADVDEALAEDSNSGYKIAIIEAEKVLRRILDEAGAIGSSPEEKLSKVAGQISDFPALERARRQYSDILHSQTYKLNSIQAEEAVRSYQIAVQDIKRGKRLPGWAMKSVRYFTLYFVPRQIWSVRRVIITLVVISLLILLLADTTIGQSITSAVVDGVRFFYHWVLFVILVVGGVGLILTFIVLYWRRRGDLEVESVHHHKSEKHSK